MSNPDNNHFKALDRIWKYLNHYPNLGLYYNCNNNTNNTNTINNFNNYILKGYTDSDWGGDLVTRKSTSGYCFLLNNNIISWNSALQKIIALSSIEAEYIALKEGA